MDVIRFVLGGLVGLAVTSVLGVGTAVMRPLNPISETAIEVRDFGPIVGQVRESTQPERLVLIEDALVERPTDIQIPNAGQTAKDTVVIGSLPEVVAQGKFDVLDVASIGTSAINRPSNSGMINPVPERHALVLNTDPAPKPAPVPKITPAEPEVSEVQSEAEPTLTESAIPQEIEPAIDERVVSQEADVVEEAPKAPALNIAAIEQNALFHEKTDKPLFSILLLAPDNPDIMIEMSELGIPITLAIATDDPIAGDIADFAFAIGMEVVASVAQGSEQQISKDLTQDQVTTRVSAGFDLLPQAVGLMDNTQAALQREETLSKLVLGELNKTGHGVASYVRPTDNIEQYATEFGVAHAQIFRVLDQNSESRSTIRRSIKRASQRAERVGTAIVLGTANNDMLVVLRDFLDSEDAKKFDFAPLSTVLLAN